MDSDGTSALHSCKNDSEPDESVSGSMCMIMSHLSMESFGCDADDEDVEFSEEKRMFEKLERPAVLFSSSDSEPGYYSLPATPPRIRIKSHHHHHHHHHQGMPESNRPVTSSSTRVTITVTDYGSENETKKCKRNKRRKRRIGEQRCDWDSISKESAPEKINSSSNHQLTGMKNGWLSGGDGDESESGGVILIARPKGGRRSLCMDMEEIKACRDLGFELEPERMLDIPSRVSISTGPTVDALSSGSNSPIAARRRISSPGDNPREVKARLKIWAQAVAQASTTSRPAATNTTT